MENWTTLLLNKPLIGSLFVLIPYKPIEPLAKLGEFCCGYAVSRPAGCETCNFQRLLLQN